MSSPDTLDAYGRTPSSPEPALPEEERRARAAAALGVRALEVPDLPPVLTGNDELAALDRLEHHLIKISGDSRGSNPVPYVSIETLETLAEFEEKPEAEKWLNGNAAAIFHDDMANSWFRRRKLYRPVLDDHDQPVYGRRIGYFSSGLYETSVLYCSDKSLRMLIKATGGHGHGGNKYVGYCRLPDPEIALPVRKDGDTNLVVYRHQQSLSLREELGLGKIPR